MKGVRVRVMKVISHSCRIGVVGEGGKVNVRKKNLIKKLVWKLEKLYEEDTMRVHIFHNKTSQFRENFIA